MNSIQILEKVKSIQSERGNEYENSQQERSFNKISTAFNAITGKGITPAEVALILQILKDVRQWADDRLHEDCVVDGVSYASLKGELLYEQYDKENKETHVIKFDPLKIQEIIEQNPDKSISFFVTPKISGKLQRVLFELGYSWNNLDYTVQFIEQPVLNLHKGIISFYRSENDVDIEDVSIRLA